MSSAASKHGMTTAEQLTSSLLENSVDLKEFLHVASILSILTEIIGCAHEIVVSVKELACLAHFRSTVVVNKAVVNLVADVEGSNPAHVTIVVED